MLPMSEEWRKLLVYESLRLFGNFFPERFKQSKKFGVKKVTFFLLQNKLFGNTVKLYKRFNPFAAQRVSFGNTDLM